MNIPDEIKKGMKMLEAVRDEVKQPWDVYIEDLIEDRPELEVFRSELGHAFYCGALAGCVITMHIQAHEQS